MPSTLNSQYMRTQILACPGVPFLERISQGEILYLDRNILLQNFSFLSMLQPHNKQEYPKNPIVIESLRCLSSCSSITLYWKTYMKDSIESSDSVLKVRLRKILC